MATESIRTSTESDPYGPFKAVQREGWSQFAPLALFTTPAAARLVRFAGVRPGQRVLDVASGTGVVAITAARRGARVTGSDLTPALLEFARENAHIAGVEVDWQEADVEHLPFDDGQFDVVTSQFGHMFAPRPEVAIGEMLRVLVPGGTLAFSTWPPEQYMGRVFQLSAQYAPPPPPGVPPPGQWGDPAVVRERLGDRVRDLVFERDLMVANALSPQHCRHQMEHASGQMLKLVQSLEANDPGRLAEFRREYDAITEQYFEHNTLRQSYLLTRAVKA